jgi:hAT family C-terminal dimerisation region
VKSNPRVYWKEHEHEFPILAKMARDILSIPGSGAGVERLFNCARDICHYRRGQLKAETITDLMLHLCSSKFDLEQSQIDIWKEYLSASEAAMMDQVRKPNPLGSDFEPISDDEEEGHLDDDSEDDDSEDDDSEDDDSEDEVSSVQATTQSERAQQKQKQPQKRTSETLDDADDGLPLPEMPTEENTLARSGRIRKKPKMPAGFEIDKL